MTNEELNTALYKKVFAEQEKYREWLLSQPPNEILNPCYEYTVREDIVLALEEYDLSDKQCKALLKSPSPLADVFKDFEKRETDHMDKLLRFIIAEVGQEVHFLGLGNILRCNIAHRASPRFTPVSQEIGPDDRIGATLDGITDVVHVVGLPLFKVLEHIRKRIGRLQECLALLIG